MLYVHGSPERHLNGWVFPEDIYNPSKMERIGKQFEYLCFNGHTHVPGIHLDAAPRTGSFSTA